MNFVISFFNNSIIVLSNLVYCRLNSYQNNLEYIKESLVRIILFHCEFVSFENEKTTTVIV